MRASRLLLITSGVLPVVAILVSAAIAAWADRPVPTLLAFSAAWAMTTVSVVVTNNIAEFRIIIEDD